MRKALFVVAGCLVFLAGSAQAVVPTPVWEYLINHGNLPVPVMTNYLNDVTDSDRGDGKSVLDTIGPLKRYDANRLLLGIRENGVNEAAANLSAAQRWVSTNYPDRSLIWINPADGKPQGIALKMGLYPVPVDPGFIAAALAAEVYDYTNQYYWSFDVSDDGYIYTSYRNKILRYPPDGTGGISATPQVVFTLDASTPSSGLLYTAAGRFPVVRVRGSGINTVILAGGLNWQRDALRLATTNGTDFFSTRRLPAGPGSPGAGSFSALIPSTDPGAFPGEERVFGGWFPGSSAGSDSSFGRLATAPPYDNPTNTFAATGTFTVTGDPGSDAVKYTATYIATVAAHKDLGYVVALSVPPWAGGPAKQNLPGWLAVHNRTNGAFLASYKLNVTEANALLTTDGSAKWEATYGWADLTRLANGDVELLWCNGVYGYGRYLMKPLLRITGIDTSAGSVKINWTGEGNGQLEKSTSLTTPNWTPIGGVSAPGVPWVDTSPIAGAAYYRIKLAP